MAAAFGQAVRKWGVPVVLCCALAACALFGGTARADERGLLGLRLMLVACGAILILLPRPADPARNMRVPLLLLGAFAATMLVQLVPLSPGLWTALPGHARFVALAELAGFPQPSRPISLAPWMTWNSLFALLPAAVALIGLGRMDRSSEHLVIGFYLVLIATSALLGIMQVSGAIDGPLMNYRYFHSDSVLGFFANRNHAAVLLATSYPVLRLWVEQSRDSTIHRRRTAVALGAGVFLLPVIIVTGSRSGMVVAMIAIALALAMAPIAPRNGPLTARWRRPASMLALVPLVLAALLALFGKALSVDRLVDDDLMAEKRLTFLPVNWDIATEFFPFGTGFGTFDPVFRMFEPVEGLGVKYFNHAHNDLLELLITGGLPAMLVLAAFLFWIARRLAAEGFAQGASALLVRAGAAIVALWFVASLTDYPLRTPLAGAVFVIAVFWIAPRPHHPDQTAAEQRA